MSKPFGVTVTIPKIKAVGTWCMRLQKWTWEVEACELWGDPGRCAGCRFGEKMVGTVEDMLPENDKT